MASNQSLMKIVQIPLSGAGNQGSQIPVDDQVPDIRFLNTANQETIQGNLQKRMVRKPNVVDTYSRYDGGSSQESAGRGKVVGKMTAVKVKHSLSIHKSYKQKRLAKARFFNDRSQKHLEASPSHQLLESLHSISVISNHEEVQRLNIPKIPKQWTGKDSRLCKALRGSSSFDQLEEQGGTEGSLDGPQPQTRDLGYLNVNSYLSGTQNQKRDYTRLKGRFLALPPIRNQASISIVNMAADADAAKLNEKPSSGVWLNSNVVSVMKDAQNKLLPYQER